MSVFIKPDLLTVQEEILLMHTKIYEKIYDSGSTGEKLTNRP